jgi:hypothetical protein
VIQDKDSCQDIDDIVSSDISGPDKVNLLRGKPGLSECIKIGLERTFNNQDWWNFQDYNYLASKFPSSDYVPILCASLDMLNPNVQPADVLLTLLDIKDPRCVPSVRRVLFWKPDWDEFHDLAFKAFDVLLSINDEESWKVIQEAADDDTRRVKELALGFLERRKA